MALGVGVGMEYGARFCVRVWVIGPWSRRGDFQLTWWVAVMASKRTSTSARRRSHRGCRLRR